jgi:hypothetical protein
VPQGTVVALEQFRNGFHTKLRFKRAARSQDYTMRLLLAILPQHADTPLANHPQQHPDEHTQF